MIFCPKMYGKATNCQNTYVVIQDDSYWRYFYLSLLSDLILDVTNKINVINSLKNNEIDFALVSVLPEEVDVEEEPIIENRLYLVGNTDRFDTPRSNLGRGSVPRQLRSPASANRYMPEPDLPTLEIHETVVDEVRRRGVVIVTDTISRYKEEYGFNKEYINGLIGDYGLNTRFEDAVAA